MKRILSTSEVVSCLSLDHSSYELVALADAVYNESESQLIVKLRTEVRPVPIFTRLACPTLDWLPKDATENEHVPLEEAFSVARDIFHSWVNRIHRSLEENFHPEATNQILTMQH